MNKRQTTKRLSNPKSGRSKRSGLSGFSVKNKSRVKPSQKTSQEISSVKTPKYKSIKIDLTGKIAQQIQKHLTEDTVQSNAKLYDIANNGLPISTLDQFNDDISMMVTSKVLPRKTLEDAQNKPDGTLSSRNSEKLIRVLRLKHKAKEALGEETAIRWMQKPNKNFNGLCAIEMAKSESGARAVEQFLGQLAHGINA